MLGTCEKKSGENDVKVKWRLLRVSKWNSFNTFNTTNIILIYYYSERLAKKKAEAEARGEIYDPNIF